MRQIHQKVSSFHRKDRKLIIPLLHDRCIFRRVVFGFEFDQLDADGLTLEKRVWVFFYFEQNSSFYFVFTVFVIEM